MGQQMIDKLKKYRVVNNATILPTVDKHHPSPVKKVPLREFPSEPQNVITKPPEISPLSKDSPPTADTNVTRNIISKSPGSSQQSSDLWSIADTNVTRNIITIPPGGSPLSRDIGPASDAAKLSGSKRQQTEPSSNAYRLQPLGNKGANGHRVYVRRKFETEPGKLSASKDVGGAYSPDLKKCSNYGVKESKPQPVLTQDPKSTLPVSEPIPVTSRPILSEELRHPGLAGQPVSDVSATESNSKGTSRMHVQGDQQSSRNPDWKERFHGLQMFLKSCDHQEKYIHKLRSLSASGRSRHAVELEKRAIQLLVEEGIELHRMQLLNVLGKALPKDSILTQSRSRLQAQFHGDGKLVDASKFPFAGKGS